MRAPAVATLLASLVPLAGCIHHRLVHPRERPAGVRTWTETFDAGDLRAHLLWAAPEGASAAADAGTLPAVLVHPLAGKTSGDLDGVVWDLAGHGFIAVAAHYERRIDGKPRETLFPWRDERDVTVVLEALRRHPRVDTRRVALLGFSQGAVFSLLIAARAADVRGVVAYYPVTDFDRWLHARKRNPLRRAVSWAIRRYFRKQSGAADDAEHRQMLAKASPESHAGDIRAPVLLIHGSHDRSAPVGESRALAERLRSLGRDVKLIEFEGGSHAFNFKSAEAGRRAWAETMAFLESCLSEAGARRPIPD